jgi:hypothetical protein
VWREFGPPIFDANISTKNERAMRGVLPPAHHRDNQRDKEEFENFEVESSSTKEVKRKVVLNNELLIFCGISICAVIGAYLRVGVSYFKIWHTETNYVSRFPRCGVSHLSFFSVSCTPNSLAAFSWATCPRSSLGCMIRVRISFNELPLLHSVLVFAALSPPSPPGRWSAIKASSFNGT